jgi:hypothetical protein
MKYEYLQNLKTNRWQRIGCMPGKTTGLKTKSCNRPSNVDSRIRLILKNIQNGHSETNMANPLCQKEGGRELGMGLMK